MPQRKNPYRAFNFIVEIASAAVAGFAEVEALTADGLLIEYGEGVGDAALRKLQASANSVR